MRLITSNQVFSWSLAYYIDWSTGKKGVSPQRRKGFLFCWAWSLPLLRPQRAFGQTWKWLAGYGDRYEV